jgi:hypothetical protein
MEMEPKSIRRPANFLRTREISHAMRADPEFQEVMKAEQAEELGHKVNMVRMLAADSSATKSCRS